ncbi:MAG TPA: hypothetical protein VG388_14930 [Solirubrobacteraceae bacterium]|nr:hypothetical protein [Solirubrobacteraceae bacterium]
MRRGPAIIVVILALGACSADAQTSGKVIGSGITGRVLEGPTCPVETVPPQSRCAPRPLVVSLVIRRVGSTAPGTSVRSAADGRFRARLTPATYTVTAPQVRSPFPRAPARVTVHVRARHFTSITLTYDTGIR